MSTQPASASGLSAEAQKVLSWFREHYYGGRPPVYSVHEVARGLYGRTTGPAPGTAFDPTAWGRLRDALNELNRAGLIEQGRLPQGDFGYRLVSGGE